MVTSGGKYNLYPFTVIWVCFSAGDGYRRYKYIDEC